MAALPPSDTDLERLAAEGHRPGSKEESVASPDTRSSMDDQLRNDDLHDLEKAPTHVTRRNDSPVRRMATAQDWTGPDDPGNPLNWPAWKKWGHVISIALLVLAVTIGVSAITPANDELAKRFHVSRTAAILSLTMFVLGLALGPVIAAPLSEIFGRSIIYKISPILYCCFLIGAGFTPNFGGLVVFRFLAGTAGSPVLAVGAGTLADMYRPQDRAPASTVYLMSAFMGPAIGPIVGGFTAQYKNWQWTQWVTIFFAVVALITTLPMQETYKRIILEKRAKKYGLPPPPKPKLSPVQFAVLILTMTVGRPMKLLFTEPIVFAFSIYTAVTFSILYSFFAAYPYTFGTVYGFNLWETGLTFLAIGIGVISAGVCTILVDRWIYQPKCKAAAARGETSVQPEERLWISMIGIVGVPIGLFWFAWTARPSIHWISPCLAGIPFAFGNTALFISTAMYFVDSYGPLNGASAMAANGSLRYILGAVFPLWTVQMYETLGVDWATSLLAFICLVLLPIPFAFYKYGPWIRSKSPTLA